MQISLGRPERAKAWREAQGLTRRELAEAIGYSQSQIQDFEEGARRGKKDGDALLGDATWRRYSLACAAIAAGLNAPW